MMKNKILCIQISTNLINSKHDKSDISQQYYKKLYDVKRNDGYVKPSKFWEIPLWITEIDYNVKTDFYVCTSVKHAINYILNSNYKYICFSVLDVNKQFIKEIITTVNKHKHNSLFILGGYIDFTKFFFDYTLYPKTVKDFIELLGIKYKQGNSYRLFKGYKTIPRLTLSTGCLNNCDFCTVENKINKISTQVIEQQVKAFKPLNFKLVYINDKTFGQCSNYKLLPRIYKAIKEYNKDFIGFIVQTTTGQLLNLSDDFIKCAHIKYIEVGIETYNDNILKQYHKPSSEALSIKALEKIRQLNNVKAITNIIIGLPEENGYTYFRTLKLLNAYKSIISHLNIYNLAIYDNTKLSKRIKCSKGDKNELSVNKSFHKDKEVHEQFYQDIHKLGINILGDK